MTYFSSDFEAPDNCDLIGNETPTDLWMLSRLASATVDANKGFENYDFVLVTTAIYNVWLYDLCDVYLVNIILEFVYRVTYFKMEKNFNPFHSQEPFWSCFPKPNVEI